MMKKFGLIGALAMAMAVNAFADTLVDRGLPTANLNNAAGANRANVAWADQEPTSTPAEYWLPGDSFAIGGPGSYQVNSMRMWVVGPSSAPPPSSGGFVLYGGVLGSSSYNPISSSYTLTPVTYSGGSSYQGSSGSFIPLYQLDFDVNEILQGSDTYQFFLNGPWTANGGSFVNAFLHASNAGLSGSPQQGSDDFFEWLHVNGSSQIVETWHSGTGAGTMGAGPGWDKGSDANIMVFGSSVPDGGSTALLLVAALTAMGMMVHRREIVTRVQSILS
jgi:hypothetical protein